MNATPTARWVSLSLALLCATILLPTSAASAGEYADAQPHRADPGGTITLVYTVNETALAEVRAIEQVSCTITEPSGASQQCPTTGSLADVRVQGSQRSYAFVIQAPSQAGNYTVHFTRGALVAVDLPPDPASGGADAHFEVLDGALSSTSGDPHGVPPAGPQGGTDGKAPSLSAAARWLMTMFMASGATIASVVAVRPGRR